MIQPNKLTILSLCLWPNSFKHSFSHLDFCVTFNFRSSRNRKKTFVCSNAYCDQFHIHLSDRWIVMCVYQSSFCSPSFSPPIWYSICFRFLRVQFYTQHSHDFTTFWIGTKPENCYKPAFVQIKPVISFGLPAIHGEQNRTRYVEKKNIDIYLINNTQVNAIDICNLNFCFMIWTVLAAKHASPFKSRSKCTLSTLGYNTATELIAYCAFQVNKFQWDMYSLSTANQMEKKNRYKHLIVHLFI